MKPYRLWYQSPALADRMSEAEAWEKWSLPLGNGYFGANVFEPLFDENHVFSGTIDGATYGENDQITAIAELIGGTFGNAKHASVFGYVSGTIENIALENVKLKVEKNADGKFENVVYIGFVASVLTGQIENCSVKSLSLISI